MWLRNILIIIHFFATTNLKTLLRYFSRYDTGDVYRIKYLFGKFILILLRCFNYFLKEGRKLITFFYFVSPLCQFTPVCRVH